MKADVLKRRWLQLKGRVREEWRDLTDDDVDRINGNIDRLVGLVQERYGYQQIRARNEVSFFLARLDEGAR